MWTAITKLLARSRVLNESLGDVVFETPEIKGASSHSFFQWRVKKNMDGGRYVVALRMLPDAYAGPQGSPTNYMHFDIESAQRLRFQLDQCIDEYYRLTGPNHEQPPPPARACRSPDGAQRNPGSTFHPHRPSIFRCAAPDFAALHPGYAR
jgi:hypothetical protein